REAEVGGLQQRPEVEESDPGQKREHEEQGPVAVRRGLPSPRRRRGSHRLDGGDPGDGCRDGIRPFDRGTHGPYFSLARAWFILSARSFATSAAGFSPEKARGRSSSSTLFHALEFFETG